MGYVSLRKRDAKWFFVTYWIVGIVGALTNEFSLGVIAGGLGAFAIMSLQFGASN